MGSVICYNSIGTTLECFEQWDTNQELIIGGVEFSSAPVFYFSNTLYKQKYPVQSELCDIGASAIVPDVLLQYAVPLIVTFEVSSLEYEIRIHVSPAQMPGGYDYDDSIDGDSGNSGSGTGGSGSSGSDIVVSVKVIDNLTTSNSTAALSAAQGVVLKGLIDTLDAEKMNRSELSTAVDKEISDAIESGELVGVKGDEGRGIISVDRTAGDGSPGTVDEYTILYSDDTTSTFTVYNGSDGCDSGGNSDWNAREGEPGHILNRPFYEENTVSTILEETAYTTSGGVILLQTGALTAEGTYFVKYNGVEYSCTGQHYSSNQCVVLGNPVAVGDVPNGLPFSIVYDEENETCALIPQDGINTGTISIVWTYEYIKKIPAKYLPDGYGSGGSIDLTGYATEQYVKEYAQPKGNYLTEVPEGYAKTEDIPKNVVKSVNGVTPDTNGNVEITIPDSGGNTAPVYYATNEPQTEIMVFDPSEIKTNGNTINIGDWIVTPSGKVYVVSFVEDYGIEANYDETLAVEPSYVKTVNGVAPDENGNVELIRDEISVDDEINNSSTNPIQNKAVYEAIDALDNKIEGHSHSEYENQNSYSSVNVNGSVIQANSPEDSISINSGENITVDIKSGVIVISSDVATTYVQNEEPTDAEDGTLWVDLDDDGDIDIETPSINIDTTLTVEGYAADAKATGDAINQVSTRVGSTSVSSQISTAVNEHARKAAPINLLDNSDFTHFVCEISRHGEQEYAGDRWILDSGEFDCWNRDPNDWYASDATLNGTIKQIVSNPPDVGTVVIEMISGTADAYYVNGEVIVTSSGGMIKNVALYEGEYTDNAIPEYNPKGYTNELRECQRYGCSIQGGIYAGVGGNGGSYVYIPLPVKLRHGQIGYNLYYEGEIISTSGSVTPTGISTSSNDIVTSGGIYIYVSHNENLSGPIVWDKPRFAFYIDTQSAN